MYPYLKHMCILEGYCSEEFQIQKDYDNLTVEEKMKCSIDEVLAIYLREVSR